MQPEANPVFQNWETLKRAQSAGKEQNKNNNEMIEYNFTPEKKTGFGFLKKMKNNLCEIKKKESTPQKLQDVNKQNCNLNTETYNFKKDNNLKKIEEEIRKKKIQQKYEFNKGKQTEIIKEGNESEEDSSFAIMPYNLQQNNQSNRNVNAKESPKVKKVNEIKEKEDKSDKNEKENEKEKPKDILLQMTLERKKIREKNEKAKSCSTSQLIRLIKLEMEQRINENESESERIFSNDRKNKKDKVKMNEKSNKIKKFNKEDTKTKDKDIVSSPYQSQRRAKQFYEIGNIIALLKEQKEELKKNISQDQSSFNNKLKEDITNKQEKESKSPGKIHYIFSLTKKLPTATETIKKDTNIHIENTTDKNVKTINKNEKDAKEPNSKESEIQPTNNKRDKEIHVKIQKENNNNNIKDINKKDPTIIINRNNNIHNVNKRNKEPQISNDQDTNNHKRNYKENNNTQIKKNEETKENKEKILNKIYKNNFNPEEMSFKDKLKRLTQIQQIEQELKNQQKRYYEKTEEQKKKLEKTKNETKKVVRVNLPEKTNKKKEDFELLQQTQENVEKSKNIKDQSKKEDLDQILKTESNFEKKDQKKFHRKNFLSGEITKPIEEDDEPKGKILQVQRNYSLGSKYFNNSKDRNAQTELNEYYKDVIQNPLNFKQPIANQTYTTPVTIFYNPKKNIIINSNHHQSQNISSLDMETPSINSVDLLHNRIQSNTFYTKNDVITVPETYKSHTPGKYSSFTSKNFPEKLQINIEDFLVLEEKYRYIINTMNLSTNIRNECFEWWNYIFNTSIYSNIEVLFDNDSSIQKILKFELLSIMVSYDVSYYNNKFTDFIQVFKMVKEIINLNHDNLIIICSYILSNIKLINWNNKWIWKLKNLVNSAKTSNMKLFDDSTTPKEKILINSDVIIKQILIILKSYPEIKKLRKIKYLYNTITQSSYKDINIFFQDEILYIDNPKGSILTVKKNGKFKSEEAPYIKSKNKKKYTLILDLDGTMIHFKVVPSNYKLGVIRERPGLIEFLECIKRYYELIVFTSATQEYADALIDSIDENKKYFDYRLYRQHTVIIENNFVKDLSRIGRPLEKMIIIDDMPQSFSLQKENGILIKAFWGEDSADRALSELKNILINIAREGDDIRKSLIKYKDEIMRKVTSNISRHQY